MEVLLFIHEDWYEITKVLNIQGRYRKFEKKMWEYLCCYVPGKDLQGKTWAANEFNKLKFITI